MASVCPRQVLLSTAFLNELIPYSEQQADLHELAKRVTKIQEECRSFSPQTVANQGDVGEWAIAQFRQLRECQEIWEQGEKTHKALQAARAYSADGPDTPYTAVQYRTLAIRGCPLDPLKVMQRVTQRIDVGLDTLGHKVDGILSSTHEAIRKNSHILKGLIQSEQKEQKTELPAPLLAPESRTEGKSGPSAVSTETSPIREQMDLECALAWVEHLLHPDTVPHPMERTILQDSPKPLEEELLSVSFSNAVKFYAEHQLDFQELADDIAKAAVEWSRFSGQVLSNRGAFSSWAAEQLAQLHKLQKIRAQGKEAIGFIQEAIEYCGTGDVPCTTMQYQWLERRGYDVKSIQSMERPILGIIIGLRALERGLHKMLESTQDSLDKASATLMQTIHHWEHEWGMEIPTPPLSPEPPVEVLMPSDTSPKTELASLESTLQLVQHLVAPEHYPHPMHLAIRGVRV